MHGPTPPTQPGQAPDYCPYGHRLGPNQVLVGWLPCGCAWAMAPGWDGEPIRGHRTYYCTACRELSDRRQTIFYWPPHKIDRTVPNVSEPFRN